ncbi:MAG: hypothetical protein PHV68_04455 [Candidatus Gastranaerophilales bacterium]|nr:hypothetical protein [Candidatus Gastranaerophilales bacterium]
MKKFSSNEKNPLLFLVENQHPLMFQGILLVTISLISLYIYMFTQF